MIFSWQIPWEVEESGTDGCNLWCLPEIELLVRCASPRQDDAESIRSLASKNLNWDRLLRLAGAHSLVPLLYWRLKGGGGDPTRIPPALETAFQKNALHSLRLTGELLQLQEAFRHEGIPLLPFKGPTLAMVAYSNLALRQFVDLDLLVPRPRALQARELLLAKGYSPYLQLSPKRDKAYLRAYYELMLSSPDGQTLVELHWAITPHYFAVPLETSPFWDRAEDVGIGGQRVPTLGAEDLLLVLCIHGAKHCWASLGLIADVAWLISRRPNLQWEIVLERARAIGSLRMVLLGLKLASGILKAPLPQWLIQITESDQVVRSLTHRVCSHLFSPPDRAGKILRSGIFHMRVRESWLDRLRYLHRLTFTPGVEDWQFAHLPSSLAFLYPVLRFPRLLHKYWMRVP